VTYLELVQAVARDSGALQNWQSLASVAGLAGKPLKIAMMTASAWTMIQNMRANWLWMRRDDTGDLTQGAACYLPASFGITNLARWIGDREMPRNRPVSLYKTSLGVSDEGAIREVPYDHWRETYGRGAQTEARPGVYAFSPANEICFGPIPDATYTVRFPYVKIPQALTANGDIPECPARFHEVIEWRAVMLLDEHDEAVENLVTARLKYAELLGDLSRDQLPAISLQGSPIA
jgi:hypothetical protein